MAATLAFDPVAAQQVESIYSTPDVAVTRIAAFRAGNPREGERVLDIGCGPGFLTRDLGLAVGAKGSAVGVDISEPMLALARHRCGDLPQVSIDKADALALAAEDATLDLACALQVYGYVQELDAALAELRRALKPGGRAVLLDTDFGNLVWESKDRDRMARVLRAYDGHVAWPDLPRVLPRRLHSAGFEVIRCEVVPILTLSYHVNTFVYGIARFIHRFVTEHGGVPRPEADAWLAEFDDLERDHAFFALNRFVFMALRR